MNLQNSYDAIERSITNNNIAEAIEMIDACLKECGNDARLHYLRGKAHVKLSQLHEALSCFITSEQIDNNKAARASRHMIESIFDFYNKDMYNP